MTGSRGAVFVTGGGSGLGAGVAHRYAALGWRVAIAGRTWSRLQSVAGACAGLPGAVSLFTLDVRDGEAVHDAIHLFAPTALVCCAAILGKSEAPATASPALFRDVQETNVYGTQNACHAAMQFWAQAARPGDIVTVASLAGIRGMQRFKGLAAYAASKHAIVGLTEALALEGRDIGVRVNAIAPGAMATPMSASLGLSPKTSPEAIVPTIEFLLDRDKSAVITGTTIEIHCNDA